MSGAGAGWGRGGGAERDGTEDPKQAPGSDMGLELVSREIMT